MSSYFSERHLRRVVRESITYDSAARPLSRRIAGGPRAASEPPDPWWSSSRLCLRVGMTEFGGAASMGARALQGARRTPDVTHFECRACGCDRNLRARRRA